MSASTAPAALSPAYAVQNTALRPTAYSGMLFYDHTGALAQFQGFNNSTHEYRINNIARVSPGGAFNGSINFMLGGASKFIVASNGNIGIGTTSPSALLEVSNAVPGGPANMWMTSYTNSIGPYYMARRARGTPAAPTAVQTGDGLAGFYGEGYGTTAFGSGFAGGMTVQAAQNWTDTAHGTALTFTTTPINATAPATRMTLDATGNLGIGTTTVPAAGLLEVSNAANAPRRDNARDDHLRHCGQLSVRRPEGTRHGEPRQRPCRAATTSWATSPKAMGPLRSAGPAAACSSRRRRTGRTRHRARASTSTRRPTGTNAPATRMTIDSVRQRRHRDDGAVGSPGYGEGKPGPLEINLTRYAGTSSSGEPNIVLRTARGTRAAPSAVQAGDELGGFGVTGYGATGFGDVGAGFGAFAAENWTDTAQGTALAWRRRRSDRTRRSEHGRSCPAATSASDVRRLPDDYRQAAGLRRYPGRHDRHQRLHQGLRREPAGGHLFVRSALQERHHAVRPRARSLTALQPVHYFWRAAEFPERQFGDGRAYGLIAQDVEQVLPELVVTNDDGFKAVDYSELPLLTIQAVKDLKSENE